MAASRRTQPCVIAKSRILGATRSCRPEVLISASVGSSPRPADHESGALQLWYGRGADSRERELVTQVAQGRTDAQIAADLYISVRTVRTHLDRIRDKTSCRRRADLTRLALQAGLL
jgi:DNA-binding CsgD family transcriptional regulator